MNKQRIRISVIIPVFNVEKYLRKCLDSICNQTFRDIEIICIDDSSDDRSYEILQEYKSRDNRFVVMQQKHVGAGVIRNQGLKLAKGEYVQFLDSDDYVEPNLLEEMYKRAERYNADVTVCSYRKVDDYGNITESRNPNSPINLGMTPLNKIFNRYDFKEDIFCLLTPVPWNKLYRKSLILDNQIEFPSLNICEDIAFVHSTIAISQRIVVFDDELINYRFNRTGSMATYRTKYTIDVVKSCIALKNFLVRKNLYEELETAFIKAFKNHIRWEIAQCNDEKYKSFLEQFKALMPDDWKIFRSALRKDYITAEFLQKIIGEKKVMLWGASFFLQKILDDEKEKNPNILGIIDCNNASWGKTFGNYTIYPPQELSRLRPDGVIMTIWSNYEQVYPALKLEFAQKYPNIELLPNIFDEEAENGNVII